MNPFLQKLHPYPFERQRALLAGANPPHDLAHISLSIGEPRHAPPEFVLRKLIDSLQGLGSYPQTAGIAPLRAAIAAWLTRRFHLPAGSLDPETMVLPVNGTREALFAFAQCMVDPAGGTGRPAVVMPNPFYQIYEGAALLAGAEPCFMANPGTTGAASAQWLPDLTSVSEAIWRRCQLLYLCSPGNPTGAVAGIDYLRQALALADRYDFVIAADECYSEIFMDESRPPAGLLQAALAAGHTAYERCMVFHSLSKRSSVPGLRSGFVAGDPALIAAFLLYRTYHGCAMPLPTQMASMAAWNDDQHVIDNRVLYRRKFEQVLPILRSVMPVEAPQAGFYLWPDIGTASGAGIETGLGDDERFTRELFERKHVTVLPGSYLARSTPHGNPGRGRVRISLVATLEECVDAAMRIRDYMMER
ncbi:succinyldiaminopimelate aminotransferase [Steroidobacter denitrificans]|uniref:Succinyldiaminopimelate aminotransferase n=1 Tax=Steroidobacter denitrificans TaxID=465721 RepID=A0A127FAB7_STEDE|nr:succinyldiaminopimelate transaminase [Steroidobacter denitrificans]AMN47364.1 succinyldiaminopimelate aminotransferase [Steroidobacter denitrificans]